MKEEPMLLKRVTVVRIIVRLEEITAKELLRKKREQINIRNIFAKVQKLCTGDYWYSL